MSASATTTPKVLVLSTRSRTGYLVWIIAVILIISNAALYKLMQYSRDLNAQWLHFDTDFDPKLPNEADIRSWRMTSTFLDNCDVNHLGKCSQIESQAVMSIRQTVPGDGLGKQLLATHKYESAIDLFHEMSILGADGEVLRLSSNPDIDIWDLAMFSSRWYLQDAFDYVQNSRDQDALLLYSRFAAILRPRIQKGEWLSLPGIDATDLPVITDLFCNSKNQLNNDVCVVEILRAIAQGETRVVSEGVDVGNFLGNYKPSVHNPQGHAIREYLTMWLWDGSGSAPKVPSDFTPDQRSAWRYGIGVALRQAAIKHVSSSEFAVCRRDLAEAVINFKAVGKDSKYFAEPSKSQLEGLEGKFNEICQPTKNSTEQ
jgi:hypothetical protein